MPSTHSPQGRLETLLAEKDRAAGELTALVRVGSLLNSSLDLDEVLRIAMEQASQAMDAEASAILLIDRETGDLVFEVATGEKGQKTKEIRLKPGEGIAGWVASHGRPARVADAQDDARFTVRVDRKTDLVTRSLLCVPLKVKDRMLGVLEVINKRAEGRFTAEDEEFLVVLSHQIAAAIDNAQLYRKVYEEKETLRAVLDSMADGVIVVDPEDRILLHNRAILGLLGVEERDLSLDRFGDERLRGLARRAVFPHGDSMSFEVDLTWTQEPRTLASTATVLKDPAGTATGAVIVMRDVTERARLEKMKNDFIATTSHKLRTPLTSILGFASILRSPKLRGPTPQGNEDTISSAAEAIEEQGRYLHELIEKLLGFTGMELGDIPLEREPVDPAGLVEEACRAVQSRAEAKSIRVTPERSSAGLGASLDRTRVVQVLANLVENAVKFSPGGTDVGVGAEGAGEEVHFWVTDRGPGIPVEDRERIFEKFYQIDRDLTGQVEGAGLGLALCRNIVAAHGGRIELESTPGEGSTFHVWLPARAGSGVRTPKPSPQV